MVSKGHFNSSNCLKTWKIPFLSEKSSFLREKIRNSNVCCVLLHRKSSKNSNYRRFCQNWRTSCGFIAEHSTILGVFRILRSVSEKNSSVECRLLEWPAGTRPALGGKETSPSNCFGWLTQVFRAKNRVSRDRPGILLCARKVSNCSRAQNSFKCSQERAKTPQSPWFSCNVERDTLIFSNGWLSLKTGQGRDNEFLISGALLWSFSVRFWLLSWSFLHSFIPVEAYWQLIKSKVSRFQICWDFLHWGRYSNEKNDTFPPPRFQTGALWIFSQSGGSIGRNKVVIMVVMYSLPSF